MRADRRNTLRYCDLSAFFMGRIYMSKRPAFLHGRGRCIFCERQPPDVKISREHIFADWLREIFPRDAATTHTHGIIDWPVTGPVEVPPTVTIGGGQGHSGTKKVKVVCATCNETWLSTKVEDAAKPILIPLIAGRACGLSVPMQRMLATWAAKTAMTAEHVNKRPAVIHQFERTWLKENLSPPPGWFVSAVPYNGAEWRDLGIFQHSGHLTIPSDNGTEIEHHLGLTFVGMGRLFLLVHYSSWSRIWDMFSGDGAMDALRIWPPHQASVPWTPQNFITDTETEYFTTYMKRILEQRVSG
jgi:hypothetical protein